jgi:hypothetical protein
MDYFSQVDAVGGWERINLPLCILGQHNPNLPLNYCALVVRKFIFLYEKAKRMRRD